MVTDKRVTDEKSDVYGDGQKCPDTMHPFGHCLPGGQPRGYDPPFPGGHRGPPTVAQGGMSPGDGVE